jgi:hypothetical protein
MRPVLGVPLLSEPPSATMQSLCNTDFPLVWKYSSTYQHVPLLAELAALLAELAAAVDRVMTSSATARIRVWRKLRRVSVRFIQSSLFGNDT